MTIGILLYLAVCSGSGFGGWEYEYQDDFSTTRLNTDSYSHSIVWPELAFPPAEPYLTFTRFTPQPPALIFQGDEGRPAHLNYCFPVGVSGPGRLLGTMEFDILPPPFAAPRESPGGLSYSVSGDGQVWTIPTVVLEGHHKISIGTTQGTCYISFTGTLGGLDNLNIKLRGEGTILRVPEDYPTIQRAIDAALPGQEVVVSPGTYWGDGNWNLELRGKAITVRSQQGPEKTIIDCQGPYQGPGKLDNRGFYIHEGEGTGTLIQGFTILYGHISGSDPLLDMLPYASGPSNPVGAGIFCENAGPTLVNCILRDCGTEFGGGIGCVNGSPLIEKCHIVGCKAGGFGNAKSGGFGGAIAILRRSEATIRSCILQSNHGYYNGYGGGIYIRASGARIEGCEIQSHDADGGLRGGAVAIGGPYSKVAMEHCILASNTAVTGSGIWIDGRHENQTGGLAGPICLVEIINCTLADNLIGSGSPANPTGGIYAMQTDIRVRNCIVYGNGGQELQIIDPVSNSPVTYSDIRGGYPGAGNLNSPPLFAPTESGEAADYHLQSQVGRYSPRMGQWVIDAKHSPCIDAGDLRDAYEQEPVPNGHRINMGAYGNTLQASKGFGSLVYHVDGTSGNDKNDGLSHETAFKTIMKAVNTTRNGDMVLVWPGVYVGPINFYGKAITLTSAADAATLTAPNDYGVSFHSAEGPGSVLQNFVIRGCVGGVFITNSSPTLNHLTVVQNTHGILAYEDSKPSIRNCIFWYNSGQDLFGCKAFYSCVEDEDPAVNGTGNLHQYPQFYDPQNGDYHLKSERGRYWPGSGGNDPGSSGMWVLDETTSPCIDAGDPEVCPVRERMPNGGRLNQGAMGGTAFASMSEWPLSHDSNRNGRVDLIDFAELAEAWLRQLEWNDPAVTVRIVLPDTDGMLSLGQGPIDITVQVNAVGVKIVRVEVYLDDKLTCLDFNGSTGWTCNGILFRTIGIHRLCARAIDSNNEIYPSDCIEVRVVD